MATKNSWNNSITAASSTLNGGTVSIGTDSADNAINIGTAGSSGRTTTIGNTTSASTLNLKCGTGNFSLASASGTLMSATSGGLVTKPLTSAFQAYLATTVTDATGDGAVWQLGTTTALTVVFDQHSDFNTNGTFTAPITGKYFFTTTMRVSSTTALMTTLVISIVTTSVTYTTNTCNPYISGGNTGGAFDPQANFFAVMTAGDTAVATITISNGAANSSSITGSTTRTTYFAGFLAC